jgi:hypothetical protein
MDWTIERAAEHVALVTMRTHRANAQNPTFSMICTAPSII